MRQSKPPALASWMLEHRLWGGRNEALAGDLLEEFQRRRSAMWYWRQVLFAIFVSISDAMRVHWLALSIQLVFVAAWVWVSAYCDAAVHRYFFFAWAPAHYHYAWVVWIAWSTVLFVALPLGIYLAAARRFSLRAYARGLAAGWSVWVIILVGGTELLRLFAHGILWGWGFRLLVISVVVPLLIAIWVALASQKKSRSATISG
jgi:hypothetical protein